VFINRTVIKVGRTERREREREVLRASIVEAARDLLSDDGLAGLSMRAIAQRIEYSPATIYLYFKDKDELIREVVHAGLERLLQSNREELARLPETADAAEQYAALGRAYARFALENTAYFRVMFELPGAAHFDEECEPPCVETDVGFDGVVRVIERAKAQGLMDVADPARTAVIGWGLLHGLTSLYLSGHLRKLVGSNDAFMALVEDAIHSMYSGFRGGAGNDAGSRAGDAAAEQPGGDEAQTFVKKRSRPKAKEGSR
jgi:AcrR family transcriptional regulator